MKRECRRILFVFLPVLFRKFFQFSFIVGTFGIHAFINVKTASGFDKSKFFTTERAFSNNLLRIGFYSRESLFTYFAFDLRFLLTVIKGKVFMSCTAMRVDSTFSRINFTFMSKNRF